MGTNTSTVVGRIFLFEDPNNCGNSCTFCRPFNPPQLSTNKLELVQAIATVDTFLQKGIKLFTITGSDPCQLEYGLADLLKYITLRGGEVQSIATHGRTFKNKELLKTLKNSTAVPFTLLIPLYGSTEVLHNTIVRSRIGGNAFIETVLALKNCKELQIPVNGNMRVLNSNKHDLTAIVNLYKAAAGPMLQGISIGLIDPFFYTFADAPEKEEALLLIKNLTAKFPGLIFDNSQQNNTTLADAQANHDYVGEKINY